MANGTSNENAQFAYGDMMKTILSFGPPQKGLTMDEVLRSVDAVKPLEKAMAAGEDHVVFSEEQYRTLREKADVFPFAIADPAIAEFGLAIRNAPEITGKN